MKIMTKEKSNPVADSKNMGSHLSNLILFNDDVNSFDFVVDTLIDVCDHDPLQAEQCAWIAHHKGKCAVKQGDKTTLIHMRKAIIERGLSAEINS